jgi:ABC-2 type transport system permease protein
MFQGIQSVALPMVQEFGYTREIEDRVLAPLPVSLVAIQKAVTGAFNGMFAALLVFPIAAIVPATPVHLDINWPVLLTLTPLACYMCGALGLTFGTRFDPRTVPMLFGIVVLPLTFLGAIYYSWESLAAIRWLQILVLVNPLVYMCEGFRAALTTSEHMSLWAVYPVMIGFSALFTWLGIAGFKKRVLS